MLLDMIKPFSNAHGYSFKDIPVILHDQAFADDISITTSTPELNQRSVDIVVRFLTWAPSNEPNEVHLDGYEKIHATRI